MSASSGDFHDVESRGKVRSLGVSKLRHNDSPVKDARSYKKQPTFLFTLCFAAKG